MSERTNMGGDSRDVYFFPSSFCSQKVLLVLAVKQIPANKRVVNLPNCENYEPWFMKINPKGQVPVLVDNGKIITDSTNIIKYLDTTYDGLVLMPELGKEKWQYFLEKCDDIRVTCITMGSIFHPDLVINSEIPQIVKDKTKAGVSNNDSLKRLQKLLDENPDMAEVYQNKMEAAKLRENSMTERGQVLSELEKIKQLLTEVNTTLAENKQKWLCGPDMTIADICLAVLLRRFKMVGLVHLWESGKLAMVEAYYTRLLQWKPFCEICKGF